VVDCSSKEVTMTFNIKRIHFLLFFLLILFLFKCRKDDVELPSLVFDYSLYGGNFYCHVSGREGSAFLPIVDGVNYNYDKILEVTVDSINSILVFDGVAFPMTTKNQRSFVKTDSALGHIGGMLLTTMYTLTFSTNYDSISYEYWYNSPSTSGYSSEDKNAGGARTSLDPTSNAAASNLIGNYILDIHQIDSYNNLDTQYVSISNLTRSGTSIYAGTEALEAGIFHSYWNGYTEYRDYNNAYTQLRFKDVRWTVDSFSYNDDMTTNSSQDTFRILNNFVGPRQ
jgi:hypothetical protein